MFSRITSQKQAAQKSQKKEEVAYDSPLDELSQRLDRLEELIEKTKNEYLESIQPDTTSSLSRRANLVNSLKRLGNIRGGAQLDTSATPMASVASATSPSSHTSPASAGSSGKNSFFRRKTPDAQFIPMDNGEELEVVEIIRRLAELVVVGERAAASAAEHNESLRKAAEKQHWGDDILEEQESVLKLKGRNIETDKYISLFEHFFERNGLSLIVQIVTGASFALTHSTNSSHSGGGEEMNTTEVDHDVRLLPPLPIATQAVQSVSILVQNVSRATSLYFILSNNHVNQLIDFPLELYHVAERKKHNQENNGMSPRRFGSPELAELTTHFVTFLKSLALRMNVETLQFFLTYPTNESLEQNGKKSSSEKLSSNENPQDVEDQPLDEVETNSTTPSFKAEINVPVSVKEVQVCFPLYARALEFCAAHQDNFVRLTAMNICLNTLRLAVVTPDDEGGETMDDGAGSSPDGVLHNAKPLPFRIRLHIAQHVCAPSRVEGLVSPIFTKLAQLWGMLEEQFRAIEMSSASRTDVDGSVKEKVAKAKETARRQKLADSLNDIAASIQDELLLLEDVLKVGLTSLNEQAIEMMIATFVYPLLLQPLLLYFQRSPVPDKILFADPLNNHTFGRDLKSESLSTSEKSLISAPTKSAFFSICAVFNFITNQPLLRLLFVALFHPLSPDTTGQTMIRAKADVACLAPDGNLMIRVDQGDKKTKNETNSDRTTYLFGTVTGKKCFSANTSYDPDDNDTCVFVLSPALVEVLEYRGEQEKVGVVARTRHNPYRKAIFKCLLLSREMSDLQPLAVLAIDAAVSVFEEKFVSDILLGLDLKKFADNMPIDERKSDSTWAQGMDDRDIGGSVVRESRQSLGAPAGGKIGFDHMGEVISSFRSCLVNALPGAMGTWRLEYDSVAAHALLCSIRGSPTAVNRAAKGVDRRCRQAAAFLADIPASLENAGITQANRRGSDEENQARGLIMDALFHAHGKTDKPILDQFLSLKSEHRKGGLAKEQFVVICRKGSFDDLCSRVSSFPSDDDSEEAFMENAISSARAWVRLDAMSVLLSSSSSTDPSSFKGIDLGGFAVKRNCSKVTTSDPKSILSSISDGFWGSLFDDPKSTGILEPLPGSVFSFVGHTAIPCVCEAPPSCASLFSVEGAKVISQGITWQSLYLIVLGRHLILAEPERKTSGEGRVVTSCNLENLTIQKDGPLPRSTSTARRMLMSHEGLGMEQPGLFHSEEESVEDDVGPFLRVRQRLSTLDIWFEDDNAVTHAFEVVNNKIMAAKGQRGKRIQDYLAQGEGSGYSMDGPME